MSPTLTAAVAATVFAFGTAIFYVLSSLERPVLGLVVSADRVVDEDDLRLTHQALLRLVPVLPPSNGIVLLAGTGLLVITVVGATACLVVDRAWATSKSARSASPSRTGSLREPIGRRHGVHTSAAACSRRYSRK